MTTANMVVDFLLDMLIVARESIKIKCTACSVSMSHLMLLSIGLV